MESPLPPNNDSSRTHRSEPELVIATWRATILSFYLNYNELAVSMETYYAQQQRSTKPILCVGQGPVSQIASVMAKMQDHLNNLIVDIDKPDRTMADWPIKKLITHTRLLNRLNQQAQIVIQLASQPPS